MNEWERLLISERLAKVVLFHEYFMVGAWESKGWELKGQQQRLGSERGEGDKALPKIQERKGHQAVGIDYSTVR